MAGFLKKAWEGSRLGGGQGWLGYGEGQWAPGANIADPNRQGIMGRLAEDKFRERNSDMDYEMPYASTDDIENEKLQGVGTDFSEWWGQQQGDSVTMSPSQIRGNRRDMFDDSRQMYEDSPKNLMQFMKSKGRYGDTELAHVNPEQKEMLEGMGGSGTINPETGMPEYFWGSLIGAGASLLGSYLGKKGAKQHTPEYLDPGTVREAMLKDTGDQRSNLGNLYGDMRGLGTNLAGGAQNAMTQGQGFLNQAQGLMSGQSPILDAMRQQQSQQLGDLGGQQMMQQNQALAARGMGGGGLSGILGMKTTSALGEQANKGLLGIQQYGLQAGQGFGQLGSQMYGQAANLGQAGTGAFAGARGTQQDILALQTGANTAAANQMAANFGADQKYKAGQAAQDQSFWGSLGGGVGGAIGKGIMGLF